MNFHSTKEQRRAFGLRRAASIANPESPADSFRAIFGDHEDAEELGAKLCESVVVKKEIEAALQGARQGVSAELAGLLAPGGQGLKEWAAKMLLQRPSDAHMDNPFSDTKVLKNGDTIAVTPDKTPLVNALGKLLGLTTTNTNINIQLPSWKPTTDVAPAWRDAENVVEIEVEPNPHSEYYEKLAEIQSQYSSPDDQSHD